MGSLTIRNLGDETKSRLRVVAARAGHSMEEHVRQLIAEEVKAAELPAQGFGTWLHQLFVGIDTSDFAVPARSDLAEPIELPE